MAQELEIEYKSMLNEAEFSALCAAFQVNASAFIKQVNYYFDTPTFALKSRKMALRIRVVDKQYDFTLKEPQNGAVLETHQLLNETEARSMIRFGVIPSGEMEQTVTKAGIDADQLVLVGELTTKRCHFPYESGRLFLDHSLYLDCDDYEIEYEAADRQTGAAIFQALLRQHAIPYRPSQSKILRLYRALQEKRS